MNRYRVMFHGPDDRTYEVTVRADGMSDNADLIVFWERGFLGLRYPVHSFAKDLFISAVQEHVQR